MGKNEWDEWEGVVVVGSAMENCNKNVPWEEVEGTDKEKGVGKLGGCP